MRAFSDESRAAELETYAKKNSPAGVGSEARKAAEEIRFRGDLKQRLVPEIKRRVIESAMK